MSVKILILIRVMDMGENDLAIGAKSDTAINPNPIDPTGELAIAGQMVDRMASEVSQVVTQRLEELNQSIARTHGA